MVPFFLSGVENGADKELVEVSVSDKSGGPGVDFGSSLEAEIPPAGDTRLIASEAGSASKIHLNVPT